MVKRVLEGKLSLIALHSAHWAKPFVRLMQERAKADALSQMPEAERATAKLELVNDQPFYKGVGRAARITPFIEKSEGKVWKLTLPACVFRVYRNDGAPSHVTTLLPQHLIAAGLTAQWDIPQTEMYGEPFHVPAPDEVLFEEKWDKGEHFRSGCFWQVGKATSSTSVPAMKPIRFLASRAPANRRKRRTLACQKVSLTDPQT